MKIPKKIIIATGVYPPEIGGPAEYARQLFETLLVQKYEVEVVPFGDLKSYPTGIRHVLYFLKLVSGCYDAEYVIALDTFSVGLPSVVFGKIFRAKTVVRVAGDFLWEAHVERVKKPILLSDFYTVSREFSLKEKIIFHLTRFVLTRSDGVVFSTVWQRDSMSRAYGLDASKTEVIENFYAENSGEKGVREFDTKVFISPSRERYIKNKNTLAEAWNIVSEKHKDIELDTKVVSHDVLQDKMSNSYVVIVPSLSEVSPNMVLDAITRGIPSVVTKDIGILDRVESMVILVDPTSPHDVARGIEEVLKPDVYTRLCDAIRARTFSHTWNEISQEFIDLYQKI